MPYISPEEVKEKRSKIKKAFPGFKFSIVNRHHSSIDVSILEAPINMITSDRDHESVNVYYIAEHYQDHPEIKNVLLKIHEIINNNNRIISEDGDYGSIPRFYTDINIGRWDKPFKFVA